MEEKGKGTWSLDIRSGKLVWDSITKKIHEVSEDFVPILEEAILFYREDYRGIVAQNVQSILDTGEAWDTISCLVTAKGHHVWVRSVGFVVEYENQKPVKIAGSFYDCGEELTDLKLRNNQSDFINSIAAISLTDTEGKIKQVNSIMLKASGYTENELLGEDHRLFNSGHHSKEFFHDLWNTILSGNVWHGEILNKAKDGSLIWFDTHIQPITDQDGTLLEFLSIRFDVTEKKMREEKDRQMYSLLTIGENSVSILHEVMNPLSIISAKLELLKREARRIENNEHFNRHIFGMENSVKRITQIFQDMRGMLNGEGQFSQFKINDVLEKVKGFMMMKLLKNKMQLIISGDLGLQYYGNDGYVMQILLNLINNAIDANVDREEKWIEISIIDIDNSEILISVIDSGLGIPKASRAKIFEPLFSTKKKVGGTGLGLSLSKQLAQTMNGELIYNSNSENTRFDLILKKFDGNIKFKSAG